MFELTPFDRRRTGISAYNPFFDFDSLNKAFFGSDSIGEFKTDITDNGESITIEADLPGFGKDDINIDVNNDRLTITAKRESKTEDKDKKGKVIRSERSYGSFSRSFDITGIDSDAIKVSSYKDGVLKLDLPKKVETKPASRRLVIE